MSKIISDPSQIIEEARTAEQQGDNKLALKKYLKFSSLAGASAQTSLSIGNLYEKTGDLFRALDAYREVVKAKDIADRQVVNAAYKRLIAIENKNLKHDHAVDYCNEALLLEPDNMDFLQEKLVALYEQSFESFGLDNRKHYDNYALAKKVKHNTLVGNMTETAHHVLINDPQNYLGHCVLGRAHSLEGANDKAELLFDKAKIIAPNEIFAYYLQGLASVLEFKYDRACQEFDKVELAAEDCLIPSCIPHAKSLANTFRAEAYDDRRRLRYSSTSVEDQLATLQSCGVELVSDFSLDQFLKFENDRAVYEMKEPYLRALQNLGRSEKVFAKNVRTFPFKSTGSSGDYVRIANYFRDISGGLLDLQNIEDFCDYNEATEKGTCWLQFTFLEKKHKLKAKAERYVDINVLQKLSDLMEKTGSGKGIYCISDPTLATIFCLTEAQALTLTDSTGLMVERL